MPVDAQLTLGDDPQAAVYRRPERLDAHLGRVGMVGMRVEGRVFHYPVAITRLAELGLRPGDVMFRSGIEARPVGPDLLARPEALAEVLDRRRVALKVAVQIIAADRAVPALQGQPDGRALGA